LPQHARGDRVPPADPEPDTAAAARARDRHPLQPQALARRARELLAAARPGAVRRAGRRPAGPRHGARVRPQPDSHLPADRPPERPPLRRHRAPPRRDPRAQHRDRRRADRRQHGRDGRPDEPAAARQPDPRDVRLRRRRRDPRARDQRRRPPPRAAVAALARVAARGGGEVTARLRAILLEAWLPVGLVVLWWFATAHSTNPFWPPLHDIWHTVKATWLFDRFDSDLVPTMRRVLIGFGVAVVIGVGGGVLLGASPLLRKALEPTLEFVRAAPAVAMIPISILVFGIDDSQKVFVIVFVAVWAILLNTTEGVRSIDPTFHDVARVYGFGRRERLLQVIL